MLTVNIHDMSTGIRDNIATVLLRRPLPLLEDEGDQLGERCRDRSRLPDQVLGERGTRAIKEVTVARRRVIKVGCGEKEGEKKHEYTMQYLELKTFQYWGGHQFFSFLMLSSPSGRAPPT